MPANIAGIAHSGEALSIAVADRLYNILVDPLPETVIVEGREYSINTDFRAGVLFEMMMNDKSQSNEDIIRQTLDIFFSEEIPDDLESAINEILWFYRCGYEPQKRRSRREPEKAADDRVFDYDIDGPLIYAAFKSQYGVDLQDVEYLHWWKFTAMFQGLHDDEQIRMIISYRSMDLGKISDKEMRSHYAALKSRYALPDGRTVEEKVNNAGSAFAGRLCYD